MSFNLIATNGQICDAVHWPFERVGKGIAYFMLAAVISFSYGVCQYWRSFSFKFK
jgi:hypothetical protein